MKDEFSMESTPTTSSQDALLASSLADRTWYYIHYKTETDEIQNDSLGYVIYHSNGTVEDVFDDSTYSGTWYISEGWLYCDYDDGDSVGWNIEIGELYGVNYLIYNSSNSPRRILALHRCPS